MARRQFTFTFTNAQPGSVVSFDGHVTDRLYAAATGSARLGHPLILDSSNSLSVWSDAAELTATTEDGAGNGISATATIATPSVTVADGTPGQNPFGGGSAASGPSWVEHDLSLLAADGIVGGADTATWADAAGPIVRQTLDVGTGSLDWLAGLPSTEFVIQYDVRIPSGQDAGTIVTAAFQVAESVTADTAAENVGLGVGLVAVSAGDTTDYALGAFVDGNPNDGNGAPVTIPADEWHTIRGVVSFSVQMFYLDGVYKGINMLSSGENAYSGGHNGPDAVGLVATGLVDFRNLKVWTRVLPA